MKLTTAQRRLLKTADSTGKVGFPRWIATVRVLMRAGLLEEKPLGLLSVDYYITDAGRAALAGKDV